MVNNTIQFDYLSMINSLKSADQTIELFANLELHSLDYLSSKILQKPLNPAKYRLASEFNKLKRIPDFCKLEKITVDEFAGNFIKATYRSKNNIKYESNMKTNLKI